MWDGGPGIWGSPGLPTSLGRRCVSACITSVRLQLAMLLRLVNMSGWLGQGPDPARAQAAAATLGRAIKDLGAVIGGPADHGSKTTAIGRQRRNSYPFRGQQGPGLAGTLRFDVPQRPPANYRIK
jgi:hypothetical protein